MSYKRIWHGEKPEWLVEKARREMYNEIGPAHPSWDGGKVQQELLYICGPMRGKPNDNFDAFNEVERMLRNAGFDVHNPASKGHLSDEYTWEQAMTTDLEWVMEADGLCLLPGVEQSEGGRLEISVARALKKKFYQAELHEFGDGDSAWNYQPIDTPPGKVVDGIDAEARRLVYGARAQTYGHPRGDFDVIAKMWSAILTKKLQKDVSVTAEEVALMMAALKLARLSSTPTHRDSQVDTIGYILCLARLQEDPSEIAAWDARAARHAEGFPDDPPGADDESEDDTVQRDGRTNSEPPVRFASGGIVHHGNADDDLVPAVLEPGCHFSFPPGRIPGGQVFNLTLDAKKHQPQHFKYNPETNKWDELPWHAGESYSNIPGFSDDEDDFKRVDDLHEQRRKGVDQHAANVARALKEYRRKKS